MTTYEISNISDWNTHVTTTPSSGDTLKLTADLGSSGSPLTSLSSIELATNVILDGQGYKIYINITDFAGAVQLTGGTVQNLGVLSIGGSLAPNRGYIVDGNVQTGYIYNCYSDGNITNTASGGIVGDSFGASNLIIERCYASGNITNTLCGGIIGRVYDSSTQITIKECYYTGDIQNAGYKSSGILGILAQSTSVLISNCYHSGTISGNGDNCCILSTYNSATVGTNPDVQINNCYGLTRQLTYTSKADLLLITNCIAPVIVENTSGIDISGDLKSGSTNNSTSLSEIQGQLTGAAANWDSEANTWTAGTDSNYPTLDQFKLGPWENYDIYTDNATLQSNYTSGGARSSGGGAGGDPHIVTVHGAKYFLDTKNTFVLFDNNSSNDKLVINANVKRGMYPVWRNKEYINGVSIMYKDMLCIISTGFRGIRAKVTKVIGDFKIKNEDLPVGDECKLFCKNCRFRTRDAYDMVLHIQEEGHEMIPNVRNVITVDVETEENSYKVRVENINESGFDPCSVFVEIRDKRKINSYLGAIIYENDWDVESLYYVGDHQ